jgi:tetratricopeptide (TPR) repeat protein
MTLDAAKRLRTEGRHEEAQAILLRLARAHPEDAEIQYAAACVHDYLGHEADAVPFYVAAIAGGLRGDDLRGAYLGLGSTYRTLGRYADAEAALREGLRRFPDANELKVFLAMVEYNLGRARSAVEALLRLVAETSADEDIRAYREAIAFYAGDIDRVWPSQ